MGEARLLYIDDDGITTFTTLPNVDGLNGVTLMRTVTTTVTDAQIKALPTTAVEIVPAQGANTLIFPVLCVGVLDATAGTYTCDENASWSLMQGSSLTISSEVLPATAMRVAGKSILQFPCIDMQYSNAGFYPFPDCVYHNRWFQS